MGDSTLKALKDISDVSKGINTVISAGVGIKNALSPKKQAEYGSAIGLRSGGQPGISSPTQFNSPSLSGGAQSQPVNYNLPSNISLQSSNNQRQSMPDHYGNLMEILKIYRG